MDKKIRKFVLVPQFNWENYLEKTEQSLEMNHSFPTDGLFSGFKHNNKIQNKEQEKPGEVLNHSQSIEKADKLHTFFASQIGKDYFKKQILEILLNSPNSKISNSRTIVVNNVDTEIGVIAFLIAIRSQRKDITALHENILSEINLPTSLISNKNVQQKKEKWISFSF